MHAEWPFHLQGHAEGAAREASARHPGLAGCRLAGRRQGDEGGIWTLPRVGAIPVSRLSCSAGGVDIA